MSETTLHDRLSVEEDGHISTSNRPCRHREEEQRSSCSSSCWLQIGNKVFGWRRTPEEHGVFGRVVARRPFAISRNKVDISGIFAVTAPGIANIIKIIRSEEHTSELQSLMRISYAVFCLKKKKESENV